MRYLSEHAELAVHLTLLVPVHQAILTELLCCESSCSIHGLRTHMVGCESCLPPVCWARIANAIAADLSDEEWEHEVDEDEDLDDDGLGVRNVAWSDGMANAVSLHMCCRMES